MVDHNESTTANAVDGHGNPNPGLPLAPCFNYIDRDEIPWPAPLDFWPANKPITHDQTIEALEGSLGKWNRIVQYLVRTTIKCWDDLQHLCDLQRGILDCHLCGLFYTRHCRGCPVLQVGEAGCKKTPYADFCEVMEEFQFLVGPLNPYRVPGAGKMQVLLLGAARRERDMLADLLRKAKEQQNVK